MDKKADYQRRITVQDDNSPGAAGRKEDQVENSSKATTIRANQRPVAFDLSSTLMTGQGARRRPHKRGKRLKGLSV
jgi:hypothetical protein